MNEHFEYTPWPFPPSRSFVEQNGLDGTTTAQFDGATSTAQDTPRLKGQLAAVRSVLRQNKHRWLNLFVLAAESGGYSEASVSARIRDLRKPKFGWYTIERRRNGKGTHEYRMV